MLSTPIINPPQSAILGVHATKDRAVVENGQVVIRPMNYLALSYDHRIIDGREGRWWTGSLVADMKESAGRSGAPAVRHLRTRALLAHGVQNRCQWRCWTWASSSLRGVPGARGLRAKHGPSTHCVDVASSARPRLIGPSGRRNWASTNVACIDERTPGGPARRHLHQRGLHPVQESAAAVVRALRARPTTLATTASGVT